MTRLASLNARALNGTGVAAEFRRRNLIPINAGLSYVGGTGFSSGLTTSVNHTVSLTSLTGGVAASPSSGDIVIVGVSFRGSSDQDISVSGYTEIADLYQDQAVNDSNCGVFYKVLSAADSSLTVNCGSASQRVAVAIQVWRGQAASPFDVTATTSGAAGIGIPAPPNISTVSNNCVVIVFGGASADETYPQTDFTVPTGMGNFVFANNSDRAQAGMASILRPTAGLYTPQQFGGGSTKQANSWNAVTMALKPA